jgi:hypothetical protein
MKTMTIWLQMRIVKSVDSAMKSGGGSDTEDRRVVLQILVKTSTAVKHRYWSRLQQ